MRESNLNELLGVQRSVPVAASRQRLRNHDTSSVYSLPNVTTIDTTRNLPKRKQRNQEFAGSGKSNRRHVLDQNRRETLLSQLLVNTEEVDFSHLHLPVTFQREPLRIEAVGKDEKGHVEARVLVVDFAVHRDTRDEGNQLFVSGNAHTYMPLFVIARRSQSPEEREAGLVTMAERKKKTE